MKGNNKVYVVMAGRRWEEGIGHPQAVYSSKAAAEVAAALLEMPDGEEQDTYAYAVEMQFYDQDS